MSSNFGLPFAAGRGQAMVRAADAMLRSLGASSVTLRFRTPLASGSVLSLTALDQDAVLAPAVLRALPPRTQLPDSPRYELLLSATAVSAQVELFNSASADDLFASALGFIYHGSLLRIESIATDELGGVPYLYRFVLVAS
jgi:hypothetical protein